MSLKDMLRVFPWDKLSHYQWASWLIAPVAPIMLFVGLGLLDLPIHLVALAAAVVTLVGTWLIGRAGEWLDRKANEAADVAGLAPPHQVSEGDVLASALGGVPAALPLLAVAAVTWPL